MPWLPLRFRSEEIANLERTKSERRIYAAFETCLKQWREYLTLIIMTETLTIEWFSYFNGMAATCCLLVCLLCGLQLCWNMFSHNSTANKTISHLLGITLLLASCSTVFDMTGTVFPELSFPYTVASTIDFLMFIVIASIANFLYSNNQPSIKVLAITATPFVIITILNICLPENIGLFTNIAALLLTSIYICYSIMLHKREKHLEDIYTDPESHSLRWIRTVTFLSFGWWALRTTLIYCESISEWYDIVMYLYISGFALFATIKVSHYGAPVSMETQMEVEQSDWDEAVATAPDTQNPMKEAVIKLLETEKIYLNPEIKVDDMAKMLGTNARYLSEMLHRDMQTSFSLLINSYRINKAKELLQNKDEKIINLSYQCGFNSNQVFFRTFAKIAGMTPAEWRKINQLQK